MSLVTPILCGNLNVEKIIIVRHGEKPKADLGQLSCKGLNRSLKLPDYFHKNFSKPIAIFAPNPAVKNQGYNYVRPLATIEPTAIGLSMPVNTEVGYNEVDQLVSTLLADNDHTGTVIVAWEHKNIVKVAHKLLDKFDNISPVPDWKENEYNMVFEFTINWNERPTKITFNVQSENIKHLSDKCPWLAV